MLGLAIFSLLCIPYIYMAVELNTLVHMDPNKGSHEYARYSDLWIMVVGAFVCLVWEHVSHSLSYDFFAQHTKGDGDQQLKKFYTNKACRTFWQMQYFFIATIWGYMVLKPTGWLPWEIGGDKPLWEAAKVSIAAD